MNKTTRGYRLLSLLFVFLIGAAALNAEGAKENVVYTVPGHGTFKVFTQGTGRKIQITPNGTYSGMILEVGTTGGKTRISLPGNERTINKTSTLIPTLGTSNGTVTVPNGDDPSISLISKSGTIASSGNFGIFTSGKDSDYRKRFNASGNIVPLPVFRDSLIRSYTLIVFIESGSGISGKSYTFNARPGYFAEESTVITEGKQDKDYVAQAFGIMLTFSTDAAYANALHQSAIQKFGLSEGQWAQAVASGNAIKAGTGGTETALRLKASLSVRLSEMFNYQKDDDGNPIADSHILNGVLFGGDPAASTADNTINNDVGGVYGEIYADVAFRLSKPFFSDFVSRATGKNFASITAPLVPGNGWDASGGLAQQALKYLTGGLEYDKFNPVNLSSYNPAEIVRQNLFLHFFSSLADTEGLDPFLGDRTRWTKSTQSSHNSTNYRAAVALTGPANRFIAFSANDLASEASFSITPNQSQTVTIKLDASKALPAGQKLVIKSQQSLAVKVVGLYRNKPIGNNDLQVVEAQYDQFNNFIGERNIPFSVESVSTQNPLSFIVLNEQSDGYKELRIKNQRSDSLVISRVFLLDNAKYKYQVSSNLVVNEYTTDPQTVRDMWAFKGASDQSIVEAILSNGKDAFGNLFVKDRALDPYELGTAKANDPPIPSLTLNGQSILLLEASQEPRSGPVSLFFWNASNAEVSYIIEKYTDSRIGDFGNGISQNVYTSKLDDAGHVRILRAIPYASFGTDIPKIFNYKVYKQLQYATEARIQPNAFTSELDLLRTVNNQWHVDGSFRYIGPTPDPQTAEWTGKGTAYSYLTGRKGYPYKIGLIPQTKSDYLKNSPYFISKVAGADSTGLLMGALFGLANDYGSMSGPTQLKIAHLFKAGVTPSEAPNADFASAYYNFVFSNETSSAFQKKENTRPSGLGNVNDSLLSYMTSPYKTDSTYLANLAKTRLTPFDIEGASLIVPRIQDIQMGDIVSGYDAGEYRIGIVVGKTTSGAPAKMADIIVVSTDRASGQAYLATWGNPSASSFGGFTYNPENFVPRRLGYINYIDQPYTKNDWDVVTNPVKHFNLKVVEFQNAEKFFAKDGVDDTGASGFDPDYNIVDIQGEPMFFGSLGLEEVTQDDGLRDYAGSAVTVKVEAPIVKRISGSGGNFDVYLIAADKEFAMPAYGYPFGFNNDWKNKKSFSYQFVNFFRTGGYYQNVNFIVLDKQTVASNLSVTNNPVEGRSQQDGKLLLKFDPTDKLFYYDDAGNKKYKYFGYVVLPGFDNLSPKIDTSKPYELSFAPQFTVLASNLEDPSISMPDNSIFITKKRLEGGMATNRLDLLYMTAVYKSMVEKMPAAQPIIFERAESADSFFSRERIHHRLMDFLNSIKPEDFTKPIGSLGTVYSDALKKLFLDNSAEQVELYVPGIGKNSYAREQNLKLDIGALAISRFGSQIISTVDTIGDLGVFQDYQSFTELNGTNRPTYMSFSAQDILLTALWDLATYADRVQAQEAAQAEAIRFFLSLTIVGGVAYSVHDVVQAIDEGKPTGEVIFTAIGGVIQNLPAIGVVGKIAARSWRTVSKIDKAVVSSLFLSSEKLLGNAAMKELANARVTATQKLAAALDIKPLEIQTVFPTLTPITGNILVNKRYSLTRLRVKADIGFKNGNPGVMFFSPVNGSALKSKVDAYMTAASQSNSALQGTLGEEITEMLVEKIGGGTVKEFKIASNQGFDRISFWPDFDNPQIIRIFDSKPMNGQRIKFDEGYGVRQMSDAWITKVANRMIDQGGDAKKAAEAILAARDAGTLERYATTVDQVTRSVGLVRFAAFAQ